MSKELEEQLKIISGQLKGKLAELNLKVKDLKYPEGMDVKPIQDVVKLLSKQVGEINKFTKANFSKKK